MVEIDRWTPERWSLVIFLAVVPQLAAEELVGELKEDVVIFPGKGTWMLHWILTLTIYILRIVEINM